MIGELDVGGYVWDEHSISIYSHQKHSLQENREKTKEWDYVEETCQIQQMEHYAEKSHGIKKRSRSRL